MFLRKSSNVTLDIFSKDLPAIHYHHIKKIEIKSLRNMPVKHLLKTPQTSINHLTSMIRGLEPLNSNDISFLTSDHAANYLKSIGDNIRMEHAQDQLREHDTGIPKKHKPSLHEHCSTIMQSITPKSYDLIHML